MKSGHFMKKHMLSLFLLITLGASLWAQGATTKPGAGTSPGTTPATTPAQPEEKPDQFNTIRMPDEDQSRVIKDLQLQISKIQADISLFYKEMKDHHLVIPDP